MAGSFDVNQLIITVEMENKCQVSLVHESLVFPWPISLCTLGLQSWRRNRLLVLVYKI